MVSGVRTERLGGWGAAGEAGEGMVGGECDGGTSKSDPGGVGRRAGGREFETRRSRRMTTDGLRRVISAGGRYVFGRG